MKNFYQINSWLIPITILLWFTFWGGIIAQIVLGAVQILMSSVIMIKFKHLTKSVQTLFTVYIIITVSVILIFRQINNHQNGGISIAFLFIIITMLLALFHLFITYKIQES